jgi:hypothetical protein
MTHNRLLFITCLFLWPFLAFSQSQDFVVENFHENTTDLSAVSSNIRDLNGTPAGLIRFVVRDTKFQFDANLGILHQEKKTGEVWLFVPQGTRRVTISHPYLGVLRGYELPVAIQSKTTYDADIVITNQTYLQSLLQQAGHIDMANGSGGQNPTNDNDILPKKDDSEVAYTAPPAVQPEDSIPSVTTPSWNETQDVLPPTPVPASTTTKAKKSEVHFTVGAGYSFMGVKGVSVSAGLDIGTFFLSADYIFGNEKVKDVVAKTSYTVESYDYTANRFAVRLGGNSSPKSVVQFLPQAGIAFTSVKGSSNLKQSYSDTYFDKANVMSVTVGLGLRIMLGKTVCLYVTPQYEYPVKPDDVFKAIKEADSTIKHWGQSFNVNAGLLLRF